MELIKFDNVSFSYKAVDDSDNAVNIPVLKNFNLSIEEGSFVAILGHNGSIQISLSAFPIQRSSI